MAFRVPNGIRPYGGDVGDVATDELDRFEFGGQDTETRFAIRMLTPAIVAGAGGEELEEVVEQARQTVEQMQQLKPPEEPFRRPSVVTPTTEDEEEPFDMPAPVEEEVFAFRPPVEEEKVKRGPEEEPFYRLLPFAEPEPVAVTAEPEPEVRTYVEPAELEPEPLKEPETFHTSDTPDVGPLEIGTKAQKAARKFGSTQPALGALAKGEQYAKKPPLLDPQKALQGIGLFVVALVVLVIAAVWVKVRR